MADQSTTDQQQQAAAAEQAKAAAANPAAAGAAPADAAAAGAAAAGAVPGPNAPGQFQTSSLYCGDLHPDVTEAVLFEVFNAVGPVASIRVCRDTMTRRSLGYGYVNFHNMADAERALDTMNYTPIRGRACRIMWLQRDPSLRKTGAGNVFVKNLDESIDNKALYDTFSLFGNILSCKVVADRTTGKSKGYGFVHYETTESANEAIEKINGMMIADKEVFVGSFVKRAAGATNWTNVYVKNLPVEFDEAKLKALFGVYGEITSVMLKVEEGEDLVVTRPRAFVQMPCRDALQRGRCYATLGGITVETKDAAHSAVAPFFKGLFDTVVEDNSLEVSKAQEAFLRNAVKALEKEHPVSIVVQPLDQQGDDGDGSANAPRACEFSCAIEAVCVAGRGRAATRLFAVKGNLVQMPGVGAIVNPANEQLDHAGGAAAAIAKAAGPQLQGFSSALVQQQPEKRVPTGTAVFTSAFNLVKNTIVVHAVGPRWTDGKHNEGKLLAAAVASALGQCDKADVDSVAIPPISSGIFGFPIHAATDIIVDTTRKYLVAHADTTSLRAVFFVDRQASGVKLFTDAMRRACGEGIDGAAVGNGLLTGLTGEHARSIDFQWSWLDDGNKWTPYDMHQNGDIEHAWESKDTTTPVPLHGDKQGIVSDSKHGNLYEVHLTPATGVNCTPAGASSSGQHMYQLNLASSFKRAIKRETIVQDDPDGDAVKAPAWGVEEWACSQATPLVVQEVASPLSLGAALRKKTGRTPRRGVGGVGGGGGGETKEGETKEGGGTPSTALVSVAGLGSIEVAGAVAAIRLLLADAVKERVHDILLESIGIDALHGEVCEKARELQVVAGVRPSKDPDMLMDAIAVGGTAATVWLQGIPSNTFNTVKGVLQDFASSADRKHKLRDLVPDWPQPMPAPAGDHKHVLERLDPNSLEYKEIDDKFHNQGTQPFAGTIERIERVVNDSLWRKHAMCKRGIKTDTGGLSANEAILFHGTRATKPEVIADDGLDFRFSQAGMWGRAAYAAVNATYSNNYAYTGAGDGTKQMFAVSAALGNAEQRAPDSGIPKPGAGFQSVYGQTNGSQVHMTYELNQVYPKYLITYRR